MKIPRTRLFLLVCLFFPGTVVHAGALRVQFLANTEVFSDTILLSNLPRNGDSILTSATAAMARENPTLSGPTSPITKTISLKRIGRLVTREEVLAAIQPSANSAPGTAPHSSEPSVPKFQLADIFFSSVVRVPIDDARLAVMQIKPDEITGCTWFRLRAAAAPAVLPFFAMACVPPALEKQTNPPQHLSPVLPRALESSISASPVLVEPGQPARLFIHSPDSQMVLVVHPLQRGRLNEIVRVRLAGSAKTLRGRVAGAGYLENTY